MPHSYFEHIKPYMVALTASSPRAPAGGCGPNLVGYKSQILHVPAPHTLSLCSSCKKKTQCSRGRRSDLLRSLCCGSSCLIMALLPTTPRSRAARSCPSSPTTAAGDLAVDELRRSTGCRRRTHTCLKRRVEWSQGCRYQCASQRSRRMAARGTLRAALLARAEAWRAITATLAAHCLGASV